jgi:hypothetical protein
MRLDCSVWNDTREVYELTFTNHQQKEATTMNMTQAIVLQVLKAATCTRATERQTAAS